MRGIYKTINFDAMKIGEATKSTISIWEDILEKYHNKYILRKVYVELIKMVLTDDMLLYSSYDAA